MLASTLDHYRRQQELTAAGLRSARRSLRLRGVDAATDTLIAYQVLAARDATRSVGDILDQHGIDADPVAEVRTASVAGTASDGRSLAGLIDQAETDYQFGLIVATQLQDVARTAFSLGMTVRPEVAGYIRALNPPSCSRCAVQAGKFFRWNSGFERHPKCDCRHEPVSREAWRDLVSGDDPSYNPNTYFDSLPTQAQLNEQYPHLTRKMRAEAGLYSQEDVFTVKGAQAIRDGADISQVVNARRGMQKAQVFGREVWQTLEGTTRRGFAYSQLRDNRSSDRRPRGERYFRTTNVRLMPESIYALAKDRDDAIRLLKLHGYVF